jgi:hypothetical protein
MPYGKREDVEKILFNSLRILRLLQKLCHINETPVEIPFEKMMEILYQVILLTKRYFTTHHFAFLHIIISELKNFPEQARKFSESTILNSYLQELLTIEKSDYQMI